MSQNLRVKILLNFCFWYASMYFFLYRDSWQITGSPHVPLTVSDLEIIAVLTYYSFPYYFSIPNSTIWIRLPHAFLKSIEVKGKIKRSVPTSNFRILKCEAIRKPKVRQLGQRLILLTIFSLWCTECTQKLILPKPAKMLVTKAQVSYVILCHLLNSSVYLFISRWNVVLSSFKWKNII